MNLSRREFVVVGLGLAVAGCAERAASLGRRPGPAWPELRPRPQPSGQPQTVRPVLDTSSAGHDVRQAIAQRPLPAIPRSQWATRRPVERRITPMGHVSRITVHHEGWTPVWFSDYDSTVARLRLIHKTHLQRHWADIGYHYIIDRAGRLWQGRDTQYQGAHVPANNEHNVGVMVLGNFELQRPTNAQMATLLDTLIQLKRRYRVPTHRVYTHQELTPTKCPGRTLQPQMVEMRRNGQLG